MKGRGGQGGRFPAGPVMSHILEANHAGFKPYRNQGIYRFLFLSSFPLFFPPSAAVLPLRQSTTLRKDNFIITAKKNIKKKSPAAIISAGSQQSIFLLFFFLGGRLFLACTQTRPEKEVRLQDAAAVSFSCRTNSG